MVGYEIAKAHPWLRLLRHILAQSGRVNFAHASDTRSFSSRWSMASETVWNPSLGIRFASSSAIEVQLQQNGRMTVATPSQRDHTEPWTSNSLAQVYRSEEEAFPTPYNLSPARAALQNTTDSGEEPHARHSSKSDSAQGYGLDDVEQITLDLAGQNLAPRSPVVSSLEASCNFNMSADLFQAAKAATPDSSESFWSHTLYEHATQAGSREKVEVRYCIDSQSMEETCREHFLGQEILGFDLEWLPWASRTDGPRESTSLIQLASASCIGLFHIAVFPSEDDLAPPTFRAIMEDPLVSKVGVQIYGDCTRLKNNLGIEVRGILELSHLHKLVKFTAAGTPELINKRPVPLANLVEEHLGLPLFKGVMVRSSDWTQHLDGDQLLYAASDVYAGVQLFRVLEAKRESLQPSPPRPHHAELNLPIVPRKPRVKNDASSNLETQSANIVPDSLQIDSLPVRSTQYTDSLSSRDHAILPPTISTSLTMDDVTVRLSSYRQSNLIAARSKPYPTSADSTRSAPTTPALPQRDPRILAAEEQMLERRSRDGRAPSIAPAALRTYYLWFSNEELDPEAIAQLLRTPPLKTHTVVSYILDAVLAEQLPFDKTRLKKEVLSSLHATALQGRCRRLAEACDMLSSHDGSSGAGDA